MTMMDDGDDELVLVGRTREMGGKCWRALREYNVEIGRLVDYKI